MIGFKQTQSVFREISNFLFILSTIEKNEKTEEWKNFNLRTDIYNRIYTVLSLKEEDMGEMEDMKKLKILDKMRPLNMYLSKLGLQEIIIPTVEEIANSRSYLVVYTPYFNNLTLKWIVTNVALPIGILLSII